MTAPPSRIPEPGQDLSLIEWRPFCYKCWRAQLLCLCQHVEVVDNSVEIIFLQHPNERTMPFNTARLAHLSLRNSRLIRGLRFDDTPVVQELLQKKERVGILFPSVDSIELAEAPAHLESLVVIDGTWREAKKILYLSPRLGEIPHYAFTPEKPSNYRIRKEPKDDYISTIEATVAALRILDKDPTKYSQLLSLFDRMVDRQVDFIQLNRLAGTAAPPSRLDTRNFNYLNQILFVMSPVERLKILGEFTPGQRTGLESIARHLFGIENIHSQEILVIPV